MNIGMELARSAGAHEIIDTNLTQEFRDVDDNVVLSCQAWRTAPNLREPIFKEIVIEFIASYELDEDVARDSRTAQCIK